MANPKDIDFQNEIDSPCFFDVAARAANKPSAPAAEARPRAPVNAERWEMRKRESFVPLVWFTAVRIKMRMRGGSQDTEQYVSVDHG